ncbi:MAG: MaoC family dehydratase [Fusobacteriaceae bacterium]|jgi:3-hydroxybutyryl-CoA dehydratase|nr:MaoC family dehydratase [Fusobacteriaceae bacterium]
MNELTIGQSASKTKVFREEDVLVFAGFTGDMNPVHINEEFAKTTKFGRRIVHGPYVYTLVGSVLGQQLPGGGSVYVSQTLKFKFPVFVGDTITCTLTVTDKNIERNRLTLNTLLTNQDGVVVIEGEAVTMPRLEKSDS